MRYLFIFFFICLLSNVNAQGIKFNKAYGNNGFDTGENIVQGPDDNYYIVGSTSSSETGNTDILVLCIDENGNQLWAQYYGTEQTDIGTDIILTSDNELLILGYTNGIGAGGYDCYLAKMSLTGSLIWEKTYGGDDWEFGYDIELHESGNYYIVGETYSYGNGNNDVYLIQINGDGDVMLEKFYGTLGNELGRKMTMADNGDLIIIGDQKLPVGNTKAWMLRVDSEGNEIWQVVHSLNDEIDEFGQDVISYNGDFIALSNLPENISEPYSSYWRINNDLDILWEQPINNNIMYGLIRKNEDSFVMLGGDFDDNAQWFYFGYDNGFQDEANGGPSVFYVGPGYESFYSGINTTDHGFICVGEANINNEGQFSVLVTKFDSLLIAPEAAEIFGLPLVVEEISYANDISLYPNPVIDAFRIDFLTSRGNLEYVIKNITGEVIFRDFLNDGVVDVESLSLGMYLIEIFEKNQLIAIKKFVVDN